METNTDTQNDQGNSGGWGWGSLIWVFILIGAAARQWGSNTKPQPDSPPPPKVTPTVVSRSEVPPPVAPAHWTNTNPWALNNRDGDQVNPGIPSVAQLHVSATDGTATLQRLVTQLPPADVALLGLGVILTGTDTYGMWVRISNTGNVPIRVFPENLRVHFGLESVGVVTTNHPLFLQRCVVKPGYYVEGLVMYQAAVDVGAVIRLLGTSFSYEDPTIIVTYGQ